MAEAEVIRTALQRREPGILDGTKKSSVALLLRGVELEMLFIKRAASTRDRFSGDVAFPGGKRDPGESGMQTVIREVHEEIGIDLEQRDAWEFLGQLHEQRLLEHVVCCYVFMQLLPQTPPLKLQASEVAGVAWVPLSFFLLRSAGDALLEERALRWGSIRLSTNASPHSVRNTQDSGISRAGFHCS